MTTNSPIDVPGKGVLLPISLPILLNYVAGNMAAYAVSSGSGGVSPKGYTATTYNGVPVTFNGHEVFDDGRNFYYLKAA